MANTVTNISSSNTFGDWVVATNSLVKENNDIAANNYVKPTGTLYLNDPTLGLQVANNAVIAGQLQVQGIGSSAYVQNNLRVDQQIQFTNTSIGLINYGQAYVNGTLYATNTGTSLSVSNNAIIGGTIVVNGSGTFNNTLNVNSSTILSNTLTVGGNAYLTNQLTVTGATTLSNNLSVTGATTLSNNLSVVGNTTLNNLTITGLLSAPNDIITNNSTSNTLTITSGATVGTTLSVGGNVYSNALISNTSITGSSLSVTNNIVANTITSNINGTIPLLTSNTITVNNAINGNSAIGYFNSIQTLGSLTVGGSFTISGNTSYNSPIFVLSSSTPNQTTHLSSFRTPGPNADIMWDQANTYWAILDVNNSNYYRVLTTEQITDNVISLSTSTVVSSNVANTLNNSINVLSGYLASNVLLQNTINSLQNTFANAAYAQANSAVSNAASASTYANIAIGNANSASTYANTGINNAASASTYANTGINNAASASTYANIAIGNANSASTYANTGINNAASASTYANTGINNAASASTYANIAIGNANSASTYANTGINNAASASTYANLAYGQANTATNNTIYLQNIANSTNLAILALSNTVSNVTSNSYSTNVAFSAFAKANGAVQTAFVTYSANGTSLTPSSNNDTLTITASVSNGILILANSTSKSINFGLQLTGVTAKTYGNTTSIPSITVDNFGRVTSISNNSITVPPGTTITANSGQLTANASTGNVAIGLATIGTAGTYGNSTSYPIITTDAYGRVTSVSNTTITSGSSVTVTDDSSNSNTYYPLLSTITSGTLTTANTSMAGLTFVPSTGTLGATIFQSLSDESLKNNVVTITNAVDIVDNLRGVYFTWNTTGQNAMGVIAQEVERVIPEVVSEMNGLKTVSYDSIVGLLIEAVKELKQEIEELKKGQ